jgi:hypothetical protein
MAPGRLHRFVHGCAFMLALLAPMFANATVTVLIDGAAYPAQLRENNELLSRLHLQRSVHARHYEGELTGVDDSWVRVSVIRGRWQGVVSLTGQRFVIDTPAQRGNGDVVLDAQSPLELMSPSSCAADGTAINTTPLAATLSTGTAAATLPAIPCQATVGGVCLLAELDLAFDLLFQQLYPTTYQDQGAALLNIVDGFYRNDLGIAFDALTMTFLSSNVFSTTTVAGDLLTDITTKKNTSQLTFIANPRAILHVVTGRDFDTTTVGIANVGSLCSASNNAGTSQVVRSGGSPSTGLTALVMAHEMGHNLGASHDGTGTNTCGGGFIMATTLVSNAAHFSSCSIGEMSAQINALSNPSACFEYPVDAILAAHPGNPASAAANENFTLAYDLTETAASVVSTSLLVTGSFAAAGGTFVSATINSLPCAVAADAQSYTCTANHTGGLIQATARVASGTTLTIAASVVASSAGSVKDIDPANNAVNASITTSAAPAAPSALAATATAAAINLTWQDNSSNEDGFRIERRAAGGAWSQIATTAANATTYADTGAASGTTYEYRVSAFGAGGTSTPSPSTSAQIVQAPASTGGGGGGGSSGAELLPLLLLWLARRRHNAGAS